MGDRSKTFKEKLIEFYDLKWIFTINREDWVTEYPFIKSSEDTSYSLFFQRTFYNIVL